jgi:hypothetical protein
VSELKKGFQSHILLFRGTRAPRCQALSKRSKQQCKKASLVGKRVCRMHGSGSGPITDAGKERCAAAKTVHGWETRKKREYRAEKFRELRELEVIMRKFDICSG